MKPKSEKSIELYHIMTERGYPEEFCDVITRNLNTDFTAQRMLWYLSHYEYLPEGEIVDGAKCHDKAGLRSKFRIGMVVFCHHRNGGHGWHTCHQGKNGCFGRSKEM